MDCIIKIIKGPEEGQEFRCSGSETIVGRSPRSHVRLSSQTISYEHAIISQMADEFMIENLSANGTFVNEERITGKVKLRAKDRLQFGQETVCRVEAVPMSASSASRRLLMIVAVASIALTVLLLIFASPTPTRPGMNMKAAYPKLVEYLEEQVQEKRLPQQSLDMMRRAWQLEMSQNRANSVQIWRDLNILLASREQDMADGEMKRTLVHFVSRMSR